MKKARSLIMVLLASIFLNLGIFAAEVHGAGPAPRQINSRGLVFNTGLSSDQIALLKDFFRLTEENVPWGYRYDDRTKELVRKFQRSKGLGADGIAGRATIDRINAEIVRNNYRLGLRTVITDFKGDLILINRSSNTLHFMKNGQVYRSYPVATGRQEGYTPDGRHKIVVKYKNPAWGGAGVSAPIPGGAANNPLGKRWLGISYGGGGKYGIHGNSNRNSIGKYVSLGCVRMLNEDVEAMYEEVKVGTPVWIGDEEGLMSYGVNFVFNMENTNI